MTRDTLKFQFILLIVLVIALPTAVQLFVITPLQRQRGAQSAAISSAQTKGGRILRDIEKLVGQFQSDQLKKDLALLDGALSDKLAPLELISSIERIADESGVDHTLVFEQEVDPKRTELQNLPLTIRAQGNFDQLMRFLRNLEQQPFYLSFDELTLEPLSPNGESNEDFPIQLFANGQTTWK